MSTAGILTVVETNVPREPVQPEDRDDLANGALVGKLRSSAGGNLDFVHQLPMKTRPAMSLTREFVFIFVICNAQFLTQATLSQALAPLHIISESFNNPSPGQLSWFIAGFSLTVGTFILIAGRLGDIFGHKLMFTIGYAWLSLWSLITGFTVYTHNQIFFDFCRSMQGLGCAVLLPCGLAILGTMYPPGKRKDFVFSVFGACAPTGSLIGAIFSSLIAQVSWWPWAYWILSIVCVGFVVLSIVVVPGPSNQDDSSSARRSNHFDWLGSAAGVCGLIFFNIAWNQAPNVGWQNPYIIVFLILGIALFVTFLIIENKVEQPLVPIGALSGEVGLVLACVMFGWSSFGIWLYYYWQFTQLIQGDTPLNVAAQFIPTSPAGWTAAAMSSILLSRMKSSWIMLISMVAFCLGNILFATNQPGRLYWKQAFWGVFITPFGMDLSFPASTLILSNLVHRRAQGMAASLVTTVVNYSIAFGLGIAGTVEVHVNRGGTDLLRGYRGAWYAGIGLSGLGILCASYFVTTDYIKEWRAKRSVPEKSHHGSE